MLPVAFAALLGVVLGRFFKVATLAPGAAATMILAFVVEWLHGASLPALLIVIVLGVVCLQLGYLLGSLTAHPLPKLHGFHPHSASVRKIPADL